MNKTKLRGFSVGLIIGLVFMACTGLAYDVLQTRTVSNTVIGASANLTVAPITLDWGIMKLFETKTNALTLANTGADKAFVYWDATPENELNGDGYTRYLLESFIDQAQWKMGFDYRITLEQDATVNVVFNLTRLRGADTRLSFTMYFHAVA